MNSKKKSGAFDNLADMLGGSLGGLVDADEQYTVLQLADIEVKPQVREVMESDDSTLLDLSESIKKHGLISPVLVRPLPSGKYELVAGERRFQASLLGGLTTIKALIRDLTDEEAATLQFVENVQRLNLSQFEEAKRVQKDLDELGSVDAVLEKYKKNRAWLSKITSLLKLPAETKRLLSEGVTADLEVISTVRQVEKADPAKARALVDTLKEQRGKVNARDVANAVKNEVKPSRKNASKSASAEQAGIVATSPDRKSEEPGEVVLGTGEGWSDSEFGQAQDILERAFEAIYVEHREPQRVLDGMPRPEQKLVTTFLESVYKAGISADLGRGVILGIRNGEFGAEGFRSFAMSAFLAGGDSEIKEFNLVNILGSVKQ